MLMPWSSGAVAALDAVRHRLDPAGRVSTAQALLSWIDIPLPGQSALHTALRDGTLWPNAAQARQIFRTSVADANWNPGTLREPGMWERLAEEAAQQQRVLRVGERHLLAVMTDEELQGQAVNAGALRERVRELELGTLTLTANEAGRHHLVPDTSALIEYLQPDQVIWSEALGQPDVVVQRWVLGTVLNELDDLKRSDSRKVASRARDHGRWLWSLLSAALEAEGAQVRHDCWVRVWRHQTLTPFRDTDHLEGAVELRSLSVHIEILSDDTLMLARASTVGLRVRRLEGKWRLSKPDQQTATSVSAEAGHDAGASPRVEAPLPAPAASERRPSRPSLVPGRRNMGTGEVPRAGGSSLDTQTVVDFGHRCSGKNSALSDAPAGASPGAQEVPSAHIHVRYDRASQGRDVHPPQRGLDPGGPPPRHRRSDEP